ncbi:zinc finger protein 684-like isoform X3 [Pleurodeles waltl]|uniref:zinc finger protein 684-like isoform X3 n=1 Tax=Pleurodeles waltl TaxID=8319 RepID=UPI003709A3E1
MSLKDLNEVAFHDTSTSFSEDEWKLLQEWQKKLYRDVMKEIHNALISLGPLIATTVCSLKAKEKEEVHTMKNKSLEIKKTIHQSPYDTMAELDVCFITKNEEPLYQNNPQHSEVRGRKDYLRTESQFFNSETFLRTEEALHFNKHLKADMEEGSTDPISEYEVVPFCIKEEEETYSVDHQNNNRTRNLACLVADDETMSRYHIIGRSGKHSGKATSENSSAIKMGQKQENGPQSGNHLWTEMAGERGREDATKCETGFSDAAHLSFHQDMPVSQRSESSNELVGNIYQATPFKCQQNIQKIKSLNSCNECKKTFSKKKYLTEHKRTHMAVRPYQCNECVKSFRRKYSLLVHKRTHTGERPYNCTICDKSFTQKGALNRHKRAHVGARPYHCNQCKKSFSQNGNLIAHQKTHNSSKIRIITPDSV